jgi:hypothetical protein
MSKCASLGADLRRRQLRLHAAYDVQTRGPKGAQVLGMGVRMLPDETALAVRVRERRVPPQMCLEGTEDRNDQSTARPEHPRELAHASAQVGEMSEGKTADQEIEVLTFRRYVTQISFQEFGLTDVGRCALQHLGSKVDSQNHVA